MKAAYTASEAYRPNWAAAFPQPSNAPASTRSSTQQEMRKWPGCRTPAGYSQHIPLPQRVYVSGVVLNGRLREQVEGALSFDYPAPGHCAAPHTNRAKDVGCGLRPFDYTASWIRRSPDRLPFLYRDLPVSGYSSRANLNTKVLDFVQFGGA